MAELTSVLGADRVMATVSYRYDDQGGPIERRTAIGGVADDRTVYTYDERGNPVGEVTIFVQREKQVDDTEKNFANEKSRTTCARHDYRYDAHGNWTERVTSTLSETASEPQPSSIERREIGYYATADLAVQ
jgi:YD repeat-containing protein